MNKVGILIEYLTSMEEKDGGRGKEEQKNTVRNRERGATEK